jgi:ABC-type nitrate/sulfonate/bicarbonate transport system substrate-binding protein
MHLGVKTSLLAILQLAGALCLTPVASADRDDWQRSRYEDQVSERDLRSFEQYLDAHRETAQQLYQDPDLLRDRRFIRDHEALHDWLDAHPDAAEAIQANPQRYLSRARNDRGEEAYQGRASLSERDLSSFERYLDTHDEVARALYQNPDLINDRRFIRNHDSLQDWLQNHPDAAQALRADPEKYLWRERTTSTADFLNRLLGSPR